MKRLDLDGYERIAESDGIDRLSKLPDSLLLTILLLLSTRDAVKTTFLSKRWNDLWTSIPCLEFNISFGFRYDLYKFRNFVYGTLAKWKGPKIQKFSLSFSNEKPLASDLDAWLLFAIENQVAELDLTRNHFLDNRSLPQCLYSCSSIRKLFVVGFDLKVEQNVQWNQLKSLTIKGEDFVSEDAMNRIISSSPRLEELHLDFKEIRESLNILSSSLKVVRISICRCSCRQILYRSGLLRVGPVVNAVLRIWAPKLSSLEIMGCVYGICLLDVSSLTSAVLNVEKCQFDGVMHHPELLSLQMFEQVFGSICHVERVTLSDWWIKCLVDMKKKDMFVPFSNAKFLKLHGCKADEMVDALETFPQLIMLVVTPDKSHYYNLDEEFRLAKTTLTSLSLLRLKTVEITWNDAHDSSIILAIEILLQNADLLDKMVLRRPEYNEELWLGIEEKVLSLPRSSPTAEVIVIKDLSF